MNALMCECAYYITTNTHFSNTIMYIVIVLAIALPVAFFVLSKKRKQPKRESDSSNMPSNARLLSAELRDLNGV